MKDETKQRFDYALETAEQYRDETDTFNQMANCHEMIVNAKGVAEEIEDNDLKNYLKYHIERSLEQYIQLEAATCCQYHYDEFVGRYSQIMSTSYWEAYLEPVEDEE